jgi:hypothetical protein
LCHAHPALDAYFFEIGEGQLYFKYYKAFEVYVSVRLSRLADGEPYAVSKSHLDMLTPGRLRGNKADGVNSKRVCKFLQIINCDVVRRALNLADIGPVQAALDAKFLLRQSLFRAQFSQSVSQPPSEIRVEFVELNLGHGPEFRLTPHSRLPDIRLPYKRLLDIHLIEVCLS